MKIGSVLAHLHEREEHFAKELASGAARHGDEHDVFHQCLTFAAAAEKRLRTLEPLERRYGGSAHWAGADIDHGTTLLEDLRALYLLTHEVAVTWVMALQAAKAARDSELEEVATTCHHQVETQAKWFLTRIKSAAPQALVTE